VKAGYTRGLSPECPATTPSKEEGPVVQRPAGSNAFEFVVVSGLRAAQLMRGSVPRVAVAHKVITTAQLEVASGKVARIPATILPPVVE
jgi:DNA-directed RNA polymerase subunit K/omega